MLNDLRGRVVLQVDGGLKTGRDVMIAAMLGAEEYGFGTAAVVAIGCVMARQCHLNTCPTGHRHAARGPAREVRRHRRAIMVRRPRSALFHAPGTEVRETLAALGLRSLDEAIGRVDLLEQMAASPARGGRSST